MSAADADIGLPEALERAASALPELADEIRPANGDPGQLARGLDAGAAQTVLAWLLEHEPSSGGELALAWAEETDSAGPVLALVPESLPKPARKALRRALHRLRSRGIAVPTATAPATVAKLAPLDEAIDEARITGLDPHGVRLVYLANDRAAGGVRLFQVAIDAARGVLELEVFEAGRGRARRFLRETEQRASWPAVAVPPASARALIAAAATQQSPDRSAPRAFVEWRSRLCEVPEGTPTPGTAVREALAGEVAEAGEALEAASEWIRAGAVGPWPPPLERVQGLLDRLQEIAKGVLIVSGAARDEQVDAALGDALDEVFDEAQRDRVARSFEETAYVWWKSGRAADARLALGAAATFRAPAPAGHPIARAMLEVLLRPALERARAGEDVPGTDDAPAGRDVPGTDDAPAGRDVPGADDAPAGEG